MSYYSYFRLLQAQAVSKFDPRYYYFSHLWVPLGTTHACDLGVYTQSDSLPNTSYASLPHRHPLSPLRALLSSNETDE